MTWLQQNWDMLLLGLAAFLFIFKGPILARVYGIEDISVHDLAAKLSSESPPLPVDVRTMGEFNDVHVKQAQLIPLMELKKRAKSLKEKYGDREVAVICRSGNRSVNGAVILKRAGFTKVYNVSGGMVHWESQGYPVKR